MTNAGARQWSIRMLLALMLSAIALPNPGLAASDANLAILYKGFVAGSTQDLKFTVYNDGLGRTPATDVTFQLVKPTTGATLKKSIPALDQNGSTDVVYHLSAPCAAGTVVRAVVALKDAANPKEATIDANACSPDLQLAIVGFAPGSLGDVQLAIHNIGPVSSAPTVANVGTVKPGAYNEAKYDVPALAPDAYFPFLYTLGGSKPTDCDGHQIKAEVKLPGDADLTNNTAETTLCAPKPPPPPTPTPLPAAQGGPEYKRPGFHTLDFQANYYQTAWHQHHSTGIFALGDCFLNTPDVFQTPGDQGTVGWYQCSLSDASGWMVAQTAVQFDLRLLDDVPAKIVTAATFTFDDAPLAKTADDQFINGVSGCVTTLGLASSDWLNHPPDDLYPNDTFVTLGSNATKFDVTSPVADMASYRYDPTLRYGFVLRGQYESLDGGSSSACESNIRNMQLHVTYLVPDQH